MRIKVSGRLKEAINPNLTRHWINALLSLPNVEYIPESSEEFADIGIDTQNNVGKSVLLDTSDPQSLVNTFDVDLLLHDEVLKLLEVPEMRPSIIFKNNGDKGIDHIDSFDIYAPVVAISPVYKYIVPNLKHAKFIPVYHSLPEEIFYNNSDERAIDVFLSGAMSPQWYPLRNIFHRALVNSDINYVYSLTGGDAAANIARINRDTKDAQIAFDVQLMNYADNLRNAKILIFCDSVFKYPLKKYIEGMACGALVVAPTPIDAEYLDFKDGENFVSVDQNNFMEKIRFYLENESERKRITDNAYQLFKERFTCEKSVERFMSEL